MGQYDEVAPLDPEIRHNTTPRPRVQKQCAICGANINRRSSMCAACYATTERKVERPSREELKRLVRENSFLSIAKQFGVSDNAIRNWCDFYGFPRRA